jgi:hypothetical protein
MRIFLCSMISVVLATSAWAVALATFVCDLPFRFGRWICESLIWAEQFIPRLTSHQQPLRRITMAATALNARHVGGVTIKGFLGLPAVRALTG